MSAAALSASEKACIQRASEWFVRLREGSASEAALQQWLALDPAHRQAWQWVTAADRRFGACLAPAAGQALLRVPARRRRALKTLALLAGTGGLSWSAARSTAPRWPTAAASGSTPAAASTSNSARTCVG